MKAKRERDVTVGSKILLEEMSWPEIKEALDNGMTTVIIFAGSVEQHGPHMAEITDTLLGYQNALDLAKRLGKTLVAPVIRPGLSEHHMALPGTITLRPEIFIGVVEDYISAYVRHGFKTIILASSHGGNFKTLARIVEEQAKKHENVRIVGGFSLSDMMSVIKNLENEDGLPSGTCGGHSCAWETSEMLYFVPHLVDMSKAEQGRMGEVTGEILQEFFERGILAISKNGILGDARPSNAGLGERYFKALQDKQEQVIRESLKGNL
jgi:creatinine amidohydrolase